LAGLHEYQPQLPWWIYTLTQANAHSWVMSRFSSYLEKKNKTKA